jgi:hypothetical protein
MFFLQVQYIFLGKWDLLIMLFSQYDNFFIIHLRRYSGVVLHNRPVDSGLYNPDPGFNLYRWSPDSDLFFQRIPIAILLGFFKLVSYFAYSHA